MPEYENKQDSVNTFNKILALTTKDGRQLLSNKINPETNMKYGGNLKKYYGGGELTEFEAGGTHQENPLGGIPIPAANASVQEGETKFQDFIFSDDLILDKKTVDFLGLPKKMKGKSFADASKHINNKFTRQNDMYEDNAKKQQLDRLRLAHDMIAMESGLMSPEMMGNEMPMGQQPKQMLAGGTLAMMAAPAVANGINLIRTANNKPVPKDLDMFNTDTQFNPNLINRDQIKTDIRTSEATAAYDIANASAGNAGTYLANRVALNSNANTNLAQANLQSDMADAQEKARIETMNFQQDAANQGKRMQVQNWNDADIATWEGALQDSIAGIGQTIGGMGTMAAREELTRIAYGNKNPVEEILENTGDVVNIKDALGPPPEMNPIQVSPIAQPPLVAPPSPVVNTFDPNSVDPNVETEKILKSNRIMANNRFKTNSLNNVGIMGEMNSYPLENPFNYIAGDFDNDIPEDMVIPEDNINVEGITDEIYQNESNLMAQQTDILSKQLGGTGNVIGGKGVSSNIFSNPVLESYNASQAAKNTAGNSQFKVNVGGKNIIVHSINGQLYYQSQPGNLVRVQGNLLKAIQSQI